MTISVKVGSQWCPWCFDQCFEGRHDRYGRFDPWSVEVSEEEIDQYMPSRHWARARRDEVRYNIAFGVHIGTRRRGVRE